MTVRVADLDDAAQREAIQSFVLAHPDAELFHQPGWSRAVERGCGARAHYLVAENGSGAIEGLLPLSEIRSPFFGNSMVSTGFGVGGGILADDPAVAETLADHGWELALSRGCTSLELRGGRIPERGWQLQEGLYADFAMDLAEDDEAILRSLRKRQEIRRAARHGLEFRAGRDASDMNAHYSVYATAMRNHGTPVFPRALFDAMAEEFGDDFEIFSTWQDGAPISTVFCLYFKGVAYPYWAGNLPESRRVSGSEAGYYRMMCGAARRGCRRVDFGRSKVGTGPYAFKQLWGMEPRPLAYAVRTADGARPREVNPLNPRYRLKIALWQKLPLALANMLGPRIARGLG
jgi:FemAB-related protein (PEP-CTERM system-associated)